METYFLELEVSFKMKRARLFFIIILIFSLFLSSACSRFSVSEKWEALTKEESQKFTTELKNTFEKYKALKAFGSLSWSSSQGHGSATVILFLAWPNLLRLQLQDPMGGNLGELVLQGKKFWLYERGKDFAWQGSLPLSPERQLKVPSYFSFLLFPQTLLRIFLRKPSLDRMHFFKGNGFYGTLKSLKKPHSHELRWDKAWNLITWNIFFPKGKRVHIQYSQYKNWKGERKPYQVAFQFIQGGEKESLIWYWEEFFIPDFREKKDSFSLPPVWAKELATKLF